MWNVFWSTVASYLTTTTRHRITDIGVVRPLGVVLVLWTLTSGCLSEDVGTNIEPVVKSTTLPSSDVRPDTRPTRQIGQEFAVILQPNVWLDNQRLHQTLRSHGLKLLTSLPPRVVTVRSFVQTTDVWPDDLVETALPLAEIRPEDVDNAPVDARETLALLAAVAQAEPLAPWVDDTILDEPYEQEPLIDSSGNAEPLTTPQLPLNTIGQPPGATAQDTSRYLAGSVAVGILLPESNGNTDADTEQWTAEEIAAAVARVQNATSFLATAEPLADVSFVLHLENKPGPGGLPGTIDTDIEGIQRIELSGGKNFPDALLQDVLSKAGPPGGFTQGTTLQRMRAYAQWLRLSYNTNWAVVLLIIDNTNAQGGRASAYIHGPAINVFSNSPSSTILHELGHTFGALDEYHPDAAKSATLLTGVQEVTNGNTQYKNGLGPVDGHGESIPSLMLSNVSYVNPYTRGAWGWYDSDHDGILDLFDAPPRITFSGPPLGSGPWSISGSAAVSMFVPMGATGTPPTTLDVITNVRWKLRNLSPEGPESPWLPVTAADGAWDDAQEDFLIVVPELPAGSYQVEVSSQTLAGTHKSLIYPHPIVTLPTVSAQHTILVDFAAPTQWPAGKPLVLSAENTTIFGDEPTLEYRWDLDNSGEPDSDWTDNPTITWTPDTSGQKQVTLFVLADDVVHSTTRSIQVLSGALPLDVGFQAIPVTTVGANGNAEVLLQPSAPVDSGLLGRWDTDGDGTFDTDWEPLMPKVVSYPIPDLRLRLSDGTPTPGGRVYKAVMVHNGWGYALDIDREQLYAVNISNPKVPKIRSAVTIPGLTIHSELVADGDFLIVSAAEEGLVRVDVSAPETALWVMGTVAANTTTRAHGLATAKGHVLVADDLGLTVIDPTGVGNLVAHLAHSAPGQLVDLDTHGDLVCAVVREENDLYAGTLVVYDIADIKNPKRRGDLHLASANGTVSWSTPTSVDATDGLCFVADVWSGARIVDVSNPDEPMLVNTLNVDGAVWDVQLRDDGLLFVASVYQLHVFTIDDPAHPKLLTNLALRFPRGIYFTPDGLIHFAGSRNGYQIGELIPGESFRSKVWHPTLQVKDNETIAESTRNVWAVSYGSPPVAKLNATVIGNQVLLDGSESTDPDKTTTWDGLLRYRWDLDGDGAFDTGFVDSSQNTTSFAVPGRHVVSVEVRDRFWGVSTATVSVCIPTTTGDIAVERCGDGLDNDCDELIDEGQESLGQPCSLGVGDCQTPGIVICDPQTGTILCGLPPNTLTPEVCGDGQDNDCSGVIDDGFDQENTPCTIGVGECASTGLWLCPPGGAWLLECNATPKLPTEETCNQKDDDCDGDIDENIVNLLPCDGPDPDNCATGVWNCVDGIGLCEEIAGQTKPELCDGKDNDCDGMVDEGFSQKGLDCDGPDADKCRLGKWACLPDGSGLECIEIGPGLVELCNGIDDDCDKLIDQNFPDVGLPCDGPDSDFCKTGTGVCGTGGWAMVCEEQAGPFVEVCNGTDDDCDGFVDEDFGSVGSQCDGPDEDNCKTGMWECQNETIAACTEAETGGFVELCNYIDDDCDGVTDEDFPGLGLPCDGPDEDLCVSGWLGCAATQQETVCHESQVVSYEICNGEDDDCDGLLDEDFPVGLPCDGPDIDYCKNGVFSCSSTGEAVVCGPESTTHIVETCNGKDDDCDGMVDEWGCTP